MWMCFRPTGITTTSSPPFLPASLDNNTIPFPSPARGMFRFGDMVSGVSLLYFTNLFQIVNECIPHLGILFDIGLHLFIVNELQRIAVLQIEVAPQ